jgi:hypothetical protein
MCLDPTRRYLGCFRRGVDTRSPDVRSRRCSHIPPIQNPSRVSCYLLVYLQRRIKSTNSMSGPGFGGSRIVTVTCPNPTHFLVGLGQRRSRGLFVTLRSQGMQTRNARVLRQPTCSRCDLKNDVRRMVVGLLDRSAYLPTCPAQAPIQTPFETRQYRKLLIEIFRRCFEDSKKSHGSVLEWEMIHFLDILERF